jgi:DNA-binding NtrC family response regulator
MSEENLLIVDDEANVISALKRVFVDDPYRIYSANSALEGMDIIKNNRIKVIISDEKMPEITGAEFLSTVRRDYPNIVRIMLTGHASLEAAMKAINQGGIYRFFMKPWTELDLRFAVKSAFEKFDLEEENRRLLSIVKKQAVDLKLIEKQYPGIAQINRDEQGSILLPNISSEELSQIIAECEKEFG